MFVFTLTPSISSNILSLEKREQRRLITNFWNKALLWKIGHKKSLDHNIMNELFNSRPNLIDNKSDHYVIVITVWSKYGETRPPCIEGAHNQIDLLRHFRRSSWRIESLLRTKQCVLWVPKCGSNLVFLNSVKCPLDNMWR